MKKVFITKKIPTIAKELLSSYFQVDEYEDKKDIPKSLLIDVVQSYDGMITMLNNNIDKEVLSYASKLSVISNYAIGVDNIDKIFAKKKGISVYNLPDIVTNSSADLTFAILLALIRHIPDSRQYVLNDQWKSFDPLLFLGEELSQKTFGIIGFGRIGRAVAARALGFGLKVIFHSKSKKEKEKKIEQKSFEDVLSLSDYLSIHVPLTFETQGMIGLKEFKKMERKPILINMARGPIVKTNDLIKALKKGLIRGAALDVIDPEPISGKHPLCQFKNCLIVPHIGTATKECRYQMAKQAAEHIINHFTLKSSSHEVV